MSRLVPVLVSTDSLLRAKPEFGYEPTRRWGSTTTVGSRQDSGREPTGAAVVVAIDVDFDRQIRVGGNGFPLARLARLLG